MSVQGRVQGCGWGWYVNTYGDLSACGQRVSDLAAGAPPEVESGSARCSLMAAWGGRYECS